MRINDDLKIVIPIGDTNDAAPCVQAFHIPISRDVFEQNFKIIAATKASMFSAGSARAASVGMTIAALTLRDEGATLAGGNGDGGASALLAEIKRLTTILAPTESGFEQLPVDIAIKQGIIDAEDWREVEAQLVFFTSVYALATKAQRVPAMAWVCSISEASSTALTLADYAASLATSKTAKNTEEKGASSVPV